MAPTHESIVERVRQAVLASSISQAELASRVDMDPTALSKAMGGSRHFRPIELAAIAEVLQVPVGWLLSVEDDPAPSTLLAARVQPSTDPSMRQAETRIDDFVEINDLLVELGYRPRPPRIDLPIEDVRPAAEQGYAMADRLRKELRIDADDLPFLLDELARFIESTLGIDVAFEPLDPGLDGMSIVRCDFRLALIGSGISATRRRFALGHEVCHILAGDSQSLKVDRNVYGYGHTSLDEVRANAFSAAFLMPHQTIVEATEGKVLDEGVIAILLGRFGVSLDALAFRLKNCGVINARETDRIRRMSSARIAMRRGRTADLQARNDRRQPELLLSRAINAYVEGAISIRPVARLLDMPPDLLLEELSPPSRHLESPGDLEVPAL